VLPDILNYDGNRAAHYPNGRVLTDDVYDARFSMGTGPHNVGWTHPDEVNSALLSFLRRPTGERLGAAAAAGRM
jgi:hypothetical protein